VGIGYSPPAVHSAFCPPAVPVGHWIFRVGYWILNKVLGFRFSFRLFPLDIGYIPLCGIPYGGTGYWIFIPAVHSAFCPPAVSVGHWIFRVGYWILNKVSGFRFQVSGFHSGCSPLDIGYIPLCGIPYGGTGYWIFIPAVHSDS